MTAAIDIKPMDFDHDTVSSARSDSGSSETAKSEVTLSSSVDGHDFPNLPTENEQARTSPFAKYLKPEHAGVYQLQEAIATTLLNTSPDMLTSFVDPTIGTFKAVYKGAKQLVIWCKGNAGFVRAHGSPRSSTVTDLP